MGADEAGARGQAVETDALRLRWRQAGIALACAAVFLLAVWPRARWMVDDAVIFQSYVRSALEGHGLRYGAGELVEGYSSPLWVLLLIALGHLGARGLLAAKALGILCGLAAVETV